MNWTAEELSRLMAANPDLTVIGGDDMTARPVIVAKPTAAPESDVTAALLQDIALAGLPAPELEYRFDSARKWAADFAWPGHKLILEVEGGIWTDGRHVRGKGFMGDIEKYNRLAILGFRLLRYTPEQVKDGTAVTGIMQILGG